MVTSVNLCGIELRNPVVPASGTFGFGLEASSFYDINCLGGISLKGTTLEPRFGNECPRIAECPDGMINSVGLQNPGVKVLVEEKIPALRKIYGGVVIANVSGFSIEEYEKCCSAVSASSEVDIIEVNVSCPNVHGGGLAFGTDAATAAQVTRAVKRVSTKPVFIKLSPNVTDIAAIARACEDAGADGISLINTLMGMRFDLKTRRPILSNITGGLSGPAVFPIALRMVYQVSKAVDIPVIGLGGISSAEDALEMMMAGATAVEVGAANLTDPFACKKIIDDLPKVMDRLKINSIAEIQGGTDR